MNTCRAIGLATLLAIVSAGYGCGTTDAAIADPALTSDEGGAPRSDAGKPDPQGDGGPRGDGSSPDGASPDGGPGDPAADGPYAVTEKDTTTTVASTTDVVAIHVASPNAAGPFPVIVVAHGFQLPPSQYYGYVKRLATFGYVALTVDFPQSFAGNDNPRQAKDLIGGLDWAKADATLGAKVDATKAGMTGHSLGGKLALLAATMDARVKAAFVLDPVDGAQNGCTAPQCVEVKELMPTLAIPTGFIGETTDSSCAPADKNFTTFYAQTKTPSLQITALGASHMSFLDDVSTCGLFCSLCGAATAPNAQVNGMARALTVAFYERHLRGNTAYDAYLTGAQATARYVTTGHATIVSK